MNLPKSARLELKKRVQGYIELLDTCGNISPFSNIVTYHVITYMISDIVYVCFLFTVYVSAIYAACDGLFAFFDLCLEHVFLAPIALILVDSYISFSSSLI